MVSKPRQTSSSLTTNPSANMEVAKMRTILLLGLVLSLVPTLGIADEPPPPPEGGLMVMTEGPCTDIATEVEGYCVMSQDMQGNIYLMFAVDGELVEIRQVVGDGYVTIWKQVEGELM